MVETTGHQRPDRGTIDEPARGRDYRMSTASKADMWWGLTVWLETIFPPFRHEQGYGGLILAPLANEAYIRLTDIWPD
jgi:hypothetical protein